MPAPASARAACPRLLIASLLIGAGGLAGSCSGAHEPAQRSLEAAHARTEIKPTANVPALLGKSIEELRRRLGSSQPLPPLLANSALYADLAPLATDSVMVFRTGGLVLAASYDVRSRHVNDLLLLGRHEDSLMHRAALRANAASYLIVPVFHTDRPGALLGLRVIPANRE